MEDDRIEIIFKLILLIGVITLLVWLSNGKNIKYKSKGVYDITS